MNLKEVKKFSSFRFLINFLFEHRIPHFIFIGMTGVGINLFLVYFFTEFVFGRERYFYGYLIGLFANLIYNFIMHSSVTFQTKNGHLKRFVIYTIFSLSITFVQALVVRKLVRVFGVDYYLFVIMTVILVFSTVSFLTFKFWLFKEN